MPICRDCQISKPETEFRRRADTGRLRPECHDCSCEISRKRWQRNKRENNSKQKKHYQENRARLLAKQNAYSAENREREAARAREWRRKNPERVRELNKAYSTENREKICEQKKIYARENPDIMKHNRRLRKARERNAPIRDLTRQQWAEILVRYGHRCAYCGADGEMTQDHDIPISRSGGHTAENVVPACMPCNMKKHDKTGEEFRALLAREAA